MTLDLECKCVLGIDPVLIYLVKVKKTRIEEAGRSPRDRYPLEHEPKTSEAKMIIIRSSTTYLTCGMAILV